QQRRRHARRGPPVDPLATYDSVVATRNAIVTPEDGPKAGRAILTLSVTNFDLAIGDASEILNALGNYARVSSSYYAAVRDYNVSLAKLARILGARDVGRGAIVPLATRPRVVPVADPGPELSPPTD
ncbi:MAG: hypothetical protein ABGY41_13420, partial [Candidatus Poribacteria bacterium]